jgi:hypothetical protein
MKNFKLATLAVFAFILFSVSLHGQTFSFTGTAGYARPQGDAFVDQTTGKSLSSFGLGYSLEFLYLLESDERIGVGIAYSGNALFGVESEDGFDIGLYGLSFYGAKARYRLFESDRKFSPYAGLGLGLAVFSTPDVTITDNITGSSTLVPGASAFSLGLAPELGLHISNFVISVAYIVPMKYTINSDTGDFNGTAGALNINLGFVYDFSL